MKRSRGRRTYARIAIGMWLAQKIASLRCRLTWRSFTAWNDHAAGIAPFVRSFPSHFVSAVRTGLGIHALLVDRSGVEPETFRASTGRSSD